MPKRQKTPDRGPASRTATATTLIAFVAIGVGTVWLATNDVASRDDGTGADRQSHPREAGVGACLTVAHPPAAGAGGVVEVLEHTALAHGHLFPALETVTVPPRTPDQGLAVALWPNGAPTTGEAAVAASRDEPACATLQGGWALRITRELLADGADRLLEQATFGEDWTATIEVSLHPSQSRVRTTLDFSGPFGVEGSCSLDETFVIDLETGSPDIVSKSHNDAGLPGLVACRRFEDELAGGGAGAQALALLPAALTDETSELTLAVSRIDVSDELVTLSGTSR